MKILVAEDDAVSRRVLEHTLAKRGYAVVTAPNGEAALAALLGAGADDYISKPFDREELEARVAVGESVVDLQLKLAAHVAELEDVMKQIKQLEGMLPIS